MDMASLPVEKLNESRMSFGTPPAFAFKSRSSAVLRTSWSTLIGVSEHRRDRANTWTLNKVQVVVCLVECVLFEFLTGAFRVTCEDGAVYTKFGRSICEQGVHADEAISIYRNIAPVSYTHLTLPTSDLV